jgi:hypothetical protein
MFLVYLTIRFICLGYIAWNGNNIWIINWERYETKQPQSILTYSYSICLEDVREIK